MATTATTDDDPMPAAPVWPGDDACCGNGCDPCVFDHFYEEQERYRAALRAWKTRNPVAGDPPFQGAGD